MSTRSYHIKFFLAAGFFFLLLSGRAQTGVLFNTSDGISNVLLPNVFTPNGDSINDVYRPYLDEITDLNMTIYDRCGNLMFESGRLRSFWDGRTDSGEPCCDGTYFCVIEATGVDGKKHHEKMALQLMTNQFFK